MDQNAAKRGPGRPVAILGAVVVALVAGLALGTLISGGSLFSSAAASPTLSPSATTSSAAPSESATASPTLQPTPTAVPIAVSLPALLGAIGDSYSQAWSVSPEYHGDHPQFSWVVGTVKNDGVLSILERLMALGATPAVVDAATSGKKMDDALRQANLVVAAAKKLAPGKTAYVTFELGTNDLCASPDPLTNADTFQALLTSAVDVLRAGLPAGSRILMLPVPDLPHFHDITQADPVAREALARTPIQGGCYPYLGSRGTNSRAAADESLARYDAALEATCKDINATEGATGRLYCTYNAALLADADFVLTDLSTYDYFHPSLSGQARMAANAWAADIWGAAPVGSRAVPGEVGAGFTASGPAVLGFAMPLGLLGRRRSQVRRSVGR